MIRAGTFRRAVALLVAATVLSAGPSVGVAAAADAAASAGAHTLSSAAAPAADAIRVVFRSYETAAISAEVNARITRLPQREGDRFRKDDVLIAFDCRRLVAEHDAAIATYKAHRAAYDAQRQLKAYQAAGRLSVDQARFEMEKAEADARGLAARRDGCTIKAPFDGRVAEKAAQLHEIAQPGQPLIRIVNESKLELVLMVPSSMLAGVRDGARLSVRVDETGELHAARIVQPTGAIDPISQSARLIGELVQASARVVPGMSGTAIFEAKDQTK